MSRSAKRGATWKDQQWSALSPLSSPAVALGHRHQPCLRRTLWHGPATGLDDVLCRRLFSFLDYVRRLPPADPADEEVTPKTEALRERWRTERTTISER